MIDSAEFKAGSEAFRQENYATAAAAYQEVWSKLGSEASSFEQSVVVSRLIESWYRNGDFATAVAWYRGRETLDQSLGPEALQWIALSMLEAGYYDESARRFQELEQNASREDKRKYALYRAQTLVRSGAAERAWRVLVPQFAEPRNFEESVFYAGVAYETKRWKEGIAYCDTALAQPGAKNLTLSGVKILKARCHAKAGDTSEAVSQILDLIDSTYESNTIYAAFEILIQVAETEDKPAINDQFAIWIKDSDFPNRQLAAKYYSILIDPNPDEKRLVENLQMFIYKNPEHALAQEARLMLGSLRPDLAEDIDLAEDSKAVEELRRHVNFESAVKLFQDAAFSSAKDSFIEITTQLEGRQKELAIFNSAISALYAGDETTYDQLEKQLSKNSSVASAMHADLIFLAGLYYASQANPKGFAVLSRFTDSYPEHASVTDAKLALAEMHLNQVPASPEGARRIFQELEQVNLSEDRKERLDYAGIWAEVLTPEDNDLLEKAKAFLINWPESPLRSQVSMLLANEFYENRLYKEAEEAFRVVARDFPGSKYRETALFFAAKSATLRDDIEVELEVPERPWEEVIELGGALANHARHQKGMDLIRSDRFNEAIRVFDEILKSDDPLEDNLRTAVRCDKGFALYLKALAFGADKNALNEAADVFAEVSRDTSATRAWRYQAAVRRGKCLELLGRESVALEIYQSLAMESSEDTTPQIGSSPLEENKWLYRAGFSAMEILEEKKDWRSAVKLAEVLAARSGARAKEAEDKADRLRLRYFVWD